MSQPASPRASEAAGVAPPTVATPSNARARVMIVDDHDVARAGLRSIVAAEPRFEVIGEARGGREAIALSQSLQPDVVLMDVRMPDLDGLAATRAIKQLQPDLPIILITMHEDPEYLLEALRVGASGYVLKGASRDTIVRTVRQVLRGEPMICPELAAPLLRHLAGVTETRAHQLQAKLTARELEVLRLLAQGKTNGQIAQALQLSVSTVKAHIEHILGKLGVSDRTQAAVRAVQAGLLPGGATTWRMASDSMPRRTIGR